MSVQNAINNQLALLTTIGQAGLNALYPNEFELYVCALELTDPAGTTLKYFIFPVMPSNLDENQPEITNIKKTAAGVTILKTPTFIPVDISLSGTFGRKFKVLLGTNYVDFIQSFQTSQGTLSANSIASGVGQVFDERVKTGYGCLKILEEIVNEAKVVDQNGGRRLIFYNPAFGTSYVVQPMNFKISMSQDTNMMHQYSLQMKGVAPLSAIQSAQQRQSEANQLNTTAYVQTQTNNVVNALNTLLSK